MTASWDLLYFSITFPLMMMMMNTTIKIMVFHNVNWAWYISHGDHSEPVGSIRLRAHCKTYRNYGSLKLNEPCQFSCYDNGSTSDPALWVSYFPLIAISKKYRSSRWNYFKAHFNKSVKRSFDCGKKNAFKLKICGIHPMGSRSSSTESESQPIYWPFALAVERKY